MNVINLGASSAESWGVPHPALLRPAKSDFPEEGIPIQRVPLHTNSREEARQGNATNQAGENKTSEVTGGDSTYSKKVRFYLTAQIIQCQAGTDIRHSRLLNRGGWIRFRGVRPAQDGILRKTRKPLYKLQQPTTETVKTVKLNPETCLGHSFHKFDFTEASNTTKPMLNSVFMDKTGELI